MNFNRSRYCLNGIGVRRKTMHSIEYAWGVSVFAGFRSTDPRVRSKAYFYPIKHWAKLYDNFPKEYIMMISYRITAEKHQI